MTKTVPSSSRLLDEKTDTLFKALSSKTRREILVLLASSAGADDERCCTPDEVCACVFVDKLGVGAPTVSHHMRILIDAGLVTAEKRGLWVHYRLRPEGLGDLVSELQALTVCSTNGGCQ